MDEELRVEEVSKEKLELDRIFNNVEEVYNGKLEASIPTGFPILDRYMSIRKNMAFLLAGYSGSAKSMCTENMFILNPVDWYFKHQNFTKTKLKIIYYSMERSKEYKLNKWLNRKIFLETGVSIDAGSNLGFPDCPRLSKTDKSLIDQYKPYIYDMIGSGIVDIFEGKQNPMAIKRYSEDWFRKNGKVEKISEHKAVYIPNDPNLITIIIKDHIGLMKKEVREGISYSSKKEIIDLAVTDDHKLRDFYGATIVNVSQLNRSIANPMRLKSADVRVQLEDIKETGDTAELSDVVLSLFDPLRYKVADPAGYDLTQLRSKTGVKGYRYVEILKSTYSADGIGIGFGIYPQQSIFKEMPARDKITKQDYEDIISGKYFRR